MDKWEIGDSYIDKFPKALQEKGVLACVVTDYYMDRETINPLTGKKTFLNAKESYLMSGVIPDVELKKVYHVEEKEVERFDREGNVVAVDIELIYKVLNNELDRKYTKEAEHFFNRNGLFGHFKELAIEKYNNLDPKDLIAFAVVDGALHSETFAERKFYTKQAIDILGMKVVKKESVINLKKRGGGENMQEISKLEGAGFLKGINDDEDDEFDE